jgi:hypothetical protein
MRTKYGFAFYDASIKRKNYLSMLSTLQRIAEEIWQKTHIRRFAIWCNDAFVMVEMEIAVYRTEHENAILKD